MGENQKSLEIEQEVNAKVDEKLKILSVDYQERNQRLLAILEQKNEEITALQNEKAAIQMNSSGLQLSDETSKALNNELNSMIDQLRQEKEDLNNQLTQQIQTTQTLNSDLEAKMKFFSNEKSDLSLQIRALTDAAKEKAQEIHRMKNEKEECLEKMSKLEVETQEMKLKLEKLELENEEKSQKLMSEKNAQSEQKISTETFAENLEKAEAKIADLQKLNETQDTEIQRKFSVILSMKAEIETYVSAVADFKQKNS